MNGLRDFDAGLGRLPQLVVDGRGGAPLASGSGAHVGRRRWRYR